MSVFPTVRRVMRKRLDSLTVGTVGGVDRDGVALVDEERNHDLGAGLECDFLKGGGGCGVALDGGLSIGNLKGHVGGELAGKAALFGSGDEHHLDVLAFLHKVGVLNHVVRQGDLLVCLFVHEVESLAVVVEELVGTALDLDGLDLGSRRESILKDAAVLEVAEFGLDESGAFAGLDVLEPDDHARLVVKLQVKSVFEISCCCHMYLCC